MKKLYLLRHAKSSWVDETLDDFDRPLNERGKRDAELVAHKLKARGIKPDLILASASKRTRKTTKRLAKELSLIPEIIHFSKNLYLASPKEILKKINKTPNTVEQLVLVGHNPGITQVTNFLANEHIINVPTSGVVCILFDIKSWSEVRNNGKIGFFIYPKMFKTE